MLKDQRLQHSPGDNQIKSAKLYTKLTFQIYIHNWLFKRTSQCLTVKSAELYAAHTFLETLQHKYCPRLQTGTSIWEHDKKFPLGDNKMYMPLDQLQYTVMK